MAGFNHTSFAGQVAGNLAYLAGEDAGVPRTLKYGALEFSALIEALPPVLGAAAPAFDRRGSNDVQVVVTAARHLFGAKLPVAGESFTDPAGRNYRIQRSEGPATSAVIRFYCGSVTSLPV